MADVAPERRLFMFVPFHAGLNMSLGVMGTTSCRDVGAPQWARLAAIREAEPHQCQKSWKGGNMVSEIEIELMGIYILKHVVQSLVQVESFTYSSFTVIPRPRHLSQAGFVLPGGDLLASSDGIRVEGILECKKEGGCDDTLSDLGSNAWRG
jgi:hypothetical protein